jgi:glycosyltransferase involved in cell wall biosynthesis
VRILHVSTFFNEHGGVEKSVSDLCRGLASTHRLDVLCTARGPSTKRELENISVTAAGGFLSMSGRPISPAFVDYIRNYDVDVVHYHLPCPMAVLSNSLARPRAKIRVATWHHDLVRHRLFNIALTPLLNRFLESLDSIIVTAPQLIDCTPALRRFRNKCIVIPLGVEHKRFEALDYDLILDIRSRFGSPLILYVGRLVYYKGCEVLLEAMRAVPQAHLIMVGTGPLQPHLEHVLQESGLKDRVHLVGWQPESTLRNLFQACDLFVLPSTLSTECFGLVQVEAMLCGKPVVNTALDTGVPWVSLHGETGLTVPPGNDVALASAINRLLGNSELRRQLGEQARARAMALFTLDQQIRATLAHYDDVLSQRHPHLAVPAGATLH